MKKFKVIAYFTDLQDNGYAYHEGDFFPRDGVTVSDQRIAELATHSNRRGIPLIEVGDNIVEATERPKEDIYDAEGGVNTSKRTKNKKNAKRTQGDIC